MFRLLALLFACSFWGILGLCFLHRRGMLPVGTLLRKCRRMPWLTQAFLALFVWHLVVSGSTKTNQTDNVGGDVTNEPPAGLMMGAPRRGAGRAPYGSDAVQLSHAPSVVWQAPVLGAGEAYSLFSSGTNETFDFSMPSNAVVATKWIAHGAATAWLRIRPADWEFPLGTNVLTEFAVSADGRVMPDPTDTNVCFAPLGVPLGLVPEANWGLLAATDRPSRFWWTLADGDLVCTWENALVGCRAEDLVTFQAAFSPSGNFAYRCDLSRLASGAEGAYSSVSFRSADDAACDAARADLDAILGDADPFAFPPGSTNTVLEHAFYAGSADGRIVFPASTEATAVLRVTATGAGRGELRVGGRVVPLVPRNGSPFALLVAVPKDETQRLYVRGDATLGVALSSDDFAFGILPDHRGGRRTGRINFPNTEATHPCIHSLNARETGVSLPVGADGGDLACAWQGPDDVEIDNFPPRAARITGRFDPRREIPVTYTVSHPRYLFGRTEFTQNARYCPKPPADDETDYLGENDPFQDVCWCCRWRTCETNCTCGCPDCGTWTDTLTNDYEFASTNWPHMEKVLKIRRPRDYSDPCYLTVPTGERHCCPCPEHRTNGVSLAYARRVSVVDGAGAEFRSSGEPLTVRIAATEPSYEPGDGTALFATNGAFASSRDYTCLGVSFSHDTADLAELNRVNRQFGLPVVVNTNLDESASIRLDVDVLLRGGRIRLSVEDATTPFEVWRYDGRSEGYAKLADAATPLDLTMAEWRRFTDHADDSGVPSTTVRIVVPQTGRATLVLHYWNVIDGRFVEDESRQTLTAINPPLLADMNRDGAVNIQDAALLASGRPFRFWINEERIKGDYVGAVSDSSNNASDLKVNGKYDLVNLFPLVADVARFKQAWGNSASYSLRSRSRYLHYCVLEDVEPTCVHSMQTGTVHAVGGVPLESAKLTLLDYQGTNLTSHISSEAPWAVLAVEASDWVYPLVSSELVVKLNGRESFSYRIPLEIDHVRNMYRWINVRHLSDQSENRATFDGVPPNNPDAARAAKRLIFLHGANVSESDAGKWGDQVFKRLWLSGSTADFYNVDWRSDMGLTGANYQQNASNAFAVASSLAPILSQIPGEKVIMAHSLGNMVVSSMIQDHGLVVSKYLMCNSAVPAEAYDPDPSLRVPQLVHPDWEDYPTNCWAAAYHALFDSIPNDDRKHLGWPGRFADVAQYAVNFYSTGDEVLELYANNRIQMQTGIGSTGLLSPDPGHLSWHKQELFKGRAILGTEHWGATDWSGWGFQMIHVPTALFPVEMPKYNAAAALERSDVQLRNDPVFNPHPDSITNAVIPLLVRAAHLTKGIPALTPATGRTNLLDILGDSRTFDENIENELHGISKPNGWPERSYYETRFLHSDMKDVAFEYNHKLYGKITEKGGLK